MKALTTKQLLDLTPLDPEVKKEALEKLPQMNADQIFDLEQICWETLTGVIYTEISARKEHAINQLAEKGGNDTIDVAKIEDDVLTELFGKTDIITTEDQLAEAKTFIQQQIAQKKQETPSNLQTPPVIN